MTIKNIQTENHDHENFDGPAVIELDIPHQTQVDILAMSKVAAATGLPNGHVGFNADLMPYAHTTVSVFPDGFSVEVFPHRGEVYWTELIPFESFKKKRFLLWDDIDGDIIEWEDYEGLSEDIADFALIHADSLNEAKNIFKQLK